MQNKKNMSSSKAHGNYKKQANCYMRLWVDAEDIARRLGLNRPKKAQAKIVVDTSKPKCTVCGKFASEEQGCQECRKIVCDKCAITDHTGRYCPTCHRNRKAISKLA